MKKAIRNLDKKEYEYYRRLKKEVFKLQEIETVDSKTLQYINKLYRRCVKWNYYYPQCAIKLVAFTNWINKNNLQRFNMYAKGFSVDSKEVLKFRTTTVRRKVARG